MNFAILTRMAVVTHMLTANGLCPDEQQSVSFSGQRIDESKQDFQDFRPESLNVLNFRLADL